MARDPDQLAKDIGELIVWTVQAGAIAAIIGFVFGGKKLAAQGFFIVAGAAALLLWLYGGGGISSRWQEVWIVVILLVFIASVVLGLLRGCVVAFS
jgi:hypothetical protein